MSTTQHEALATAQTIRLLSEGQADERAAELIEQQHALIVEMAEALEDMYALDEADRLRFPGDEDTCLEARNARNAIAAAKDYIK